jgi:hypothetical protein
MLRYIFIISAQIIISEATIEGTIKVAYICGAKRI